MSEPTDQEQKPWLFKPGQSGNPAGRPKGSRNKLAEAFVEALHDDFQQHGPDAIARVRDTDPATYMRVCASILPKELTVKVDPLEDLSDAELDKRIRQLATLIGLEIRAGQPASGAEAASGPEQAGGVPPLH